jgi:hypothetical protein
VLNGNNAGPLVRLPASDTVTGSPAPSTIDVGERPGPDFHACRASPQGQPRHCCIWAKRVAGRQQSGVPPAQRAARSAQSDQFRVAKVAFWGSGGGSRRRDRQMQQCEAGRQGTARYGATWPFVVAGGRSPSTSARQRGRSLVAVRRPDTKQRPSDRPLSWGFGARREGFEPPTARSVVWCSIR